MIAMKCDRSSVKQNKISPSNPNPVLIMCMQCMLIPKAFGKPATLLNLNTTG
jgi:hypothetical protein